MFFARSSKIISVNLKKKKKFDKWINPQKPGNVMDASFSSQIYII